MLETQEGGGKISGLQAVYLPLKIRPVGRKYVERAF